MAMTVILGNMAVTPGNMAVLPGNTAVTPGNMTVIPAEAGIHRLIRHLEARSSGNWMVVEEETHRCIAVKS